MSRKRQSLISRKILKPTVQLANKIGQIKRELARLMAMRLENIYQVRLLAHQLWVSYKGKDGRCCSTFFSYRKLLVWQNLVLQAIAESQDLPGAFKLRNILKFEFKRYPYPSTIIDTLQQALETHIAYLTGWPQIAL
ncbi:hypothetical protein NG798_20445 [Ancylothrix sp. C2]|uniref:hypothetical protein n=1 Tax=Ancylothrix sp. D3o TaxID=2953691 RepID=UPI0021BB6B20|nr:hypothetical protein [Ancylothrix sp. D3o]MCT7952171.1 hypothetical protein [Ancylothrix sp. D3o]